MGRSSKFSFPIPGSKSRLQRKNADAPPSEHQSLSKAERFLGEAGLVSSQSSRNNSINSFRQQSVSSGPSYTSLTYSDADTCKDSDLDVAAPYSNIQVPFQSRTLQHRASSDALGKGGRTASTGTSTRPYVKSQRSTSTLKSFYDKQTSPLYISQQTSESSIRDRALRKGKPPVVNPLAERERSGHQDVGGQPISDAETSRKWKPHRLDLSRLFPKHTGGSNPPREKLPPEIFTSPSRIFAGSRAEYFLGSSRRLHSSGSKTSDAPEPASPPPVKMKISKQWPGASRLSNILSTAPEQGDAPEIQGVKTRDAGYAKGGRDWFDSLPEWDEDDDDLLEEDEEEQEQEQDEDEGEEEGEVEMPTPKLEPEFLPDEMHRVQAPGAPPVPPSPPPFEIEPSRALGPPSRSSRDRHILLNLADGLELIDSAPAIEQNLDRSNRTKTKRFSQSNLVEESILSCSDEESAQGLTSIRGSIAVSDVTDESDILIGRAQALQVRTRPRENPKSDDRSGRSSISSSIVSASTSAHSPTHLTVPIQYRRRSASHARTTSSIAEDTSEIINSSDSSLSPESKPAGQGTGVAKKADIHKLMAVTAEEEALLEAIRRARAKHNYVKGSSTRRPVTAQSNPGDSASIARRRKFSGRPEASFAQQHSNRSFSALPIAKASMLDCLPISPGQRSSLRLSASLGLPSPPPSAALPSPPPPLSTDVRERQRSLPGLSSISNTKNTAGCARNSLSHQTVCSSAGSLDSRLPSNGSRRVSATAALTLRRNSLNPHDANVDGTVDSISTVPATVQSGVKTSDASFALQPHESKSPAPSTGSHASPLPLPVTPQSRHGSADDTPSAVDGLDLPIVEDAKLTDVSSITSTGSNSRQSVISSSTDIFDILSDDEDELATKLAGEVVTQEEGQTAIGIQLLPTKKTTNLSVDVSRANGANQSSYSPLAQCGHEACALKRLSTFSISRCSVSEDVLTAWGELGGWRNVDWRSPSK